MSDYGFSQQQKDFIKLQFKYALRLNQRLAEGTITQAYYDNRIWLTAQQLESPYAGFWDEFKKAVDEKDLAWLSKTIGVGVTELTQFMGSAIGNVVGGTISGVSTGIVEGLLGSFNFWGWLTVAGVGYGLYYAYKKGYLKQALKVATKNTI